MYWVLENIVSNRDYKLHKLFFLGGCIHFHPGIGIFTWGTSNTLFWLRSLICSECPCWKVWGWIYFLCAQCGDLYKISKYLLCQRNGKKQWICSMVIIWEIGTSVQTNHLLVVGLSRRRAFSPLSLCGIHCQV